MGQVYDLPPHPNHSRPTDRSMTIDSRRIDPTECVFDRYAVYSTSGNDLYILKGENQKGICRIDARYLDLIQPEMASLDQGKPTVFVCIGDSNPLNPDDWRISLNYYKARHEQAKAQPSQPVLSEVEHTLVTQPPIPTNTEWAPSRYKSVTFSVSTADHDYMTALWKKLKAENPRYDRFGDFNGIMYSHLVQLLRLGSLESSSLPADCPF